MTRTCLTVIAVAGMSMSSAFAQQPSAPAKESKPAPYGAAKQPDKAKGDKPMLPPGMSEADMQACMAAATPGPNHEHLQKAVGTWKGTTTMWMAPGTEPATSECTSVTTSMMDGRFTKCEVNGEMPGMGPFQGFGIYGYDNVAKKFTSTWVDNCGTGMATGTGELSADGKTLTWTCTYNCPIKKGPITMREVDRWTGPNAMTLEMYGPDHQTGKEFQMMRIDLTRTSPQPARRTDGGTR
jgi:hypothetical protein